MSVIEYVILAVLALAVVVGLIGLWKTDSDDVRSKDDI